MTSDAEPRMVVVHAFDGDRCPSCVDAYQRAAYYVWGAAHEFDADAIRTGRCALGRYPTCAHRLTVRGALAGLMTQVREAREWTR